MRLIYYILTICCIIVITVITVILLKYNTISTFTAQSNFNSNDDGKMTFEFLEKGIPNNYYMNPRTVNSPYKNKNFAGYWGSSVFSNSNYNAIKNIYKTTGVQL